MEGFNRAEKPYDRPNKQRGRRESGESTHERERGSSRLFRGAQEFQAGHKQGATLGPRPSYQPRRTFLSGPSTGGKGDRMAKHSLNEQTEQPQYDQISKRVTFTHEPNTAGLSEQARGNLTLQQAQAVVGSSGSGALATPFKQWERDSPTNDDCLVQQKQPQSPIQIRAVVTSPSSSSRRRRDSHEAPLPLKRCSCHSNEDDAQPKEIQGQSPHVDAGDRPLTFRDMERFTRAVQGSIRDMGLEFLAALEKMRAPDDSEEELELE